MKLVGQKPKIYNRIEIYFKVEPPDMQTHGAWHQTHNRAKCGYQFAHEGDIFRYDPHDPAPVPKPLLIRSLTEGRLYRYVFSLAPAPDEGARFSAVLFIHGKHAAEAALWGVGNDDHISKGYIHELGEDGSIRKYYDELKKQFNYAYREAFERVLEERGIIKPKKSSDDKK